MKQLFVSAFFLLLASVLTLEAQQTVSLTYSGSTGYSLVERTNLRRYINGKYVGLTSREVRSFISPAEAPRSSLADDGVHWYDGSFYVLEATKSNARETASGIHDSIPSVFSISEDGTLSMYRDNGYPSFRSFPAFTRQKLRVGDAWKATAERAVDPMNKGVFTRIPMEVTYQFCGEEAYKGQDVYRIKAVWQTQYGSMETRDPRGDSSLVRASGSHSADILVLKATGAAILIMDAVDEAFQYTDGTLATFKGTINLFTEFPPVLDTEKLLPALQRIATVLPDDVREPAAGAQAALPQNKAHDGTAQASNDSAVHEIASPSAIVVEKTTAGLRLSVRNIQFAANSDEIAGGESARLDEIAEVLKLAPDSQFLVEGHTASVGMPEGEQRLSESRARRIAAELSRRGVNTKAFICRGFGGTRPIADNSTDSGRAQNRRVEITILE